ncbi:hypothetical protein KC19_4G133600 [Ceratodon purpureus]|uniref:Uncharacterized protein n=1 Tax=Ceratodon purpureus TaxID=3225 RepID=A0A8T0IBW2_CERPU|nr:hypothetical protein KC19_4G133600 [Ceratodon purpureus]
MVDSIFLLSAAFECVEELLVVLINCIHTAPAACHSGSTRSRVLLLKKKEDNSICEFSYLVHVFIIIITFTVLLKIPLKTSMLLVVQVCERVVGTVSNESFSSVLALFSFLFSSY